MSLGQYFSQYDVRDIAAEFSPSSNPQVDGELLLGYNDLYTSSQLNFNFTSWNNSVRDTNAFLVWVKEQVRAGYYVTLGVYTNEYLFYCDTDKSAGDADYDHIVSVVGVESNHTSVESAGVFYPDDVLYFSDHGLWNPSPSGTGPRYIFNYTFADIQATRKEANSRGNGASVYSLPSDTAVGNYGLAVSGVLDADNVLMPVRLDTSVNYESPEIKDGSSDRPAAMPVTLTVTVSGLQQGHSYVLFKYDDETAVPSRGFNANASQASVQWNISLPINCICSEYTLTDSILSSDKAIYRAVSSSAP